jgi:hypothetical protein
MQSTQFQADQSSTFEQTEGDEPLQELGERRMSHGLPSAPIRVFGLSLPLARLIPQDVHSIVDYANALFVASSAMMTRDPRAKLASLILGFSDLSVSSITDYRLSVAKIVPIETHEKIDHLWGLAAIAAPFLFGYWKTAPRVAIGHVVAGVGNILASLVTDYRAVRGVGRHHQRQLEAY